MFSHRIQHLMSYMRCHIQYVEELFTCMSILYSCCVRLFAFYFQKNGDKWPDSCDEHNLSSEFMCFVLPYVHALQLSTWIGLFVFLKSWLFVCLLIGGESDDQEEQVVETKM